MPEHTDTRAAAESIDLQIGNHYEKVLALGEEVMSPTGELVRKEPSPAMLKTMQSYVQMHGVNEKASGMAKSVSDALKRQRDLKHNPPPLRLTGTDGKNTLVTEVD